MSDIFNHASFDRPIESIFERLGHSSLRIGNVSEHELLIRSHSLESNDEVYSNKHTPKNHIEFHDVGSFNAFLSQEIVSEPELLFQLSVWQHPTTV